MGTESYNQIWVWLEANRGRCEVVISKKRNCSFIVVCVVLVCGGHTKSHLIKMDKDIVAMQISCDIRKFFQNYQQNFRIMCVLRIRFKMTSIFVKFTNEQILVKVEMLDKLEKRMVLFSLVVLPLYLCVCLFCMIYFISLFVFYRV